MIILWTHKQHLSLELITDPTIIVIKRTCGYDIELRKDSELAAYFELSKQDHHCFIHILNSGFSPFRFESGWGIIRFPGIHIPELIEFTCFVETLRGANFYLSKDVVKEALLLACLK